MGIPAYITLTLAPGLYRNGTLLQAKGRWHDANLIRFQQDEVKPIGGWQLRSSGSFNSSSLRRVVTLAANSLATTLGLKAVVVTDNGHGASVGDIVVISGAAAVGGIASGDLNGHQTVTATTPNTWTFQAADAATSTATGGGTPALQYEVSPGAARCALSWRDNSNNNWIAVGTSQHLYVQDESGANHDITPLRLTSRTLGANPLAATAGSSLVTVTDAGHGASIGDRVLLSGATAVGGLAAVNLAGWFGIVSVTTNTYVVDVGVGAASTATGGGSAVVARYEINPLGANPLTTTSGSAIIRVSDTAHGALAGDTVILRGATALAGFTTGQLNAAFVIVSVIDANTYTITGPQNATSGTSGGGAAVVAQYQLTTINGGHVDASKNLGYGGATYGTGYYGVARPDTGSFLPATVWSLDAWGEDLVACSDTDGAIYQWTLAPDKPAQIVPNAPKDCAGIVVTQEGFLFALGADGDGRRVAWCDQQDDETWTPDATNQAGDYDLATVGTLQCGKALPSGALCFTDVDLWKASYLGAPLVYGFERVGSGCGVISKGAVGAVDSTAVWMGPGPVFWRFDGQAVQPLDCDVLGFVSDMNANQASKVTAVHVALYGEIWWFFPSGASTENDAYVVWCYRESERLGRSIWSMGRLARTCGTGKGVFANPLMVDAPGNLWLHESGLNYQGAAPYVESGPIEIGDGETMAEIQRVIPDEMQDGNLTATVYGRLWPDGAEFSSGPFVLASPTELLFQAREIRVRFTANNAAPWRLGAMRLELVQGDPL